MSAMGKLVLSIQTMLDDNESTDTMISMLCDDYGMSKETALEFISFLHRSLAQFFLPEQQREQQSSPFSWQQL